MGNLFAGLTTGSQALSYYTRGIETAGHNIANAGTEGFARQRVNARENTPSAEGTLLVGQGVIVESIDRMRDLFLDAQYRAQLPTLGYWETKAANISNMEYYVGSLNYNTFKDVLDQFWTDVEALHSYPEISTVRETMLSSAENVITSLLGMRNSYDEYRSVLNDQVYDMVKESNKLIDDIAVLCGEISSAQSAGMNPNDLLDKRDLLAERLCKLTGATVGSPTMDEADGDYKIELNGRLLVQGAAQYNSSGGIKNTRHLVLVPMVGNFGYYDVQIEYNQYDHISDLSVASVVIERGATPPNLCGRDGLHELFVERLSNGKTWMVGGARGQSTGGDRIDGIYDKTQALNLDGSFSLQVGNAGVQALSKSYFSLVPADNGVVKSAPLPGDPDEYEFKIAAGPYETYLNIKFDGANWNFSATNCGATLPSSVGADLTIDDIANAIEAIRNPDDGNEQAFRARVDDNGALTIEASNTEVMRGHILSITDFRGTLAQEMGIANKNPAVEITVVESDSLETIANKINAAYKTSLVAADNDAAYKTNPPGVAPSSPEEWLHATVVREPDGTYYLALTSDVSGEANRINILPSDVCGSSGNLSTARRLGLVESAYNDNTTSYMQFNESADATSTIITDRTVGGDVFVNDAYFIYDDSHYLSESNSFADARIFKTQSGSFPNDWTWVNRMADTLDSFGTGIRLNLHGLNTRYSENGSLYSPNGATLIRVEPQITNGEIYAMLETRDDMILGLEDYFDNIVYEMVTEINAVHYSGHGVGANANTTGTAFFEHISARYGASTLNQFQLNSALKTDKSLIAGASGDGNGYSMGEGDWSNILRMAQLKITKVFESGTADFSDYFKLFMADLGTQGYTANYMLQAQQNVSDQLQTLRESVMGVNTDEELMDIIRFQQGVGAISRYMTAIDDMLDRIINGMGRVGL
ncbi:MAG: flagellar hook-associated protein FlgK [Synergistaceae bacterium]|jgi:flagellar hook-associated protein 1 FlgK|nr:flagellar hook-associated protein FlgK [Synergistaceae bacterium]